MNKQTAVQKLISELRKSKDFQRVINEVNLSSTSVRDTIQESLQMEREQIIDAYIECWSNDGGDCRHKIKEADQYYEQTYGGNK